MRKLAETIAARVKRTIVIRHSRPSRSDALIDERIIAELEDETAWEEPIEVHRGDK